MLFLSSSAAASSSFLLASALIWTNFITRTIAQATSGLVQCAPAQIQVGGGTGPYVVSVLPVGGDGTVGTTPLETFPALNRSGAASWLVNIPSGTTVRLGVRDGTGAISYSDPITIQAGQSDTCLSGSLSASISSVPASSTASLSSATESTLTSSTTSDATLSTTVISSATITTTSEITSGSSTSTTRLTITSLSTSVRPPNLPGSTTSSGGGNTSSGSGKVRSFSSVFAIVVAAASAFAAI